MTTHLPQELIDRFGEKHVPRFQELLNEEPAVREQIASVLAGSFLELIALKGIDHTSIPDEIFSTWAFSPTGELHKSVIEEEQWSAINALSAPLQQEILTVWQHWTYDEAFAVFSVDYEVKKLSRFTARRFEAFVEEWGRVTHNELKQIFSALLEMAQENSGLALEWQLPMALGDWPGRVEVPYVDAKPERVPEEEAVVSGANGKKVSI